MGTNARSSDHPIDIGIVAIKDDELYRFNPYHPYAKLNHGFVREDSLVLEATLGRTLRGHEAARRRNADLYDNRPDNLTLDITTTEPSLPRLSEIEYILLGKLGSRIDAVIKIPRCCFCGFPVADGQYYCKKHIPMTADVLRTCSNKPALCNIIIDVVRGLSARELLKKYPQYNHSTVQHLLWCSDQDPTHSATQIAERFVLWPAPTHIYNQAGE